MFDIFGISTAVALCLTGFTFGAAVLCVALRNDNYAPATIGVVILVASLSGFYFLDKPVTETRKNLAESGTEYKAVHQNEIKSFVNCYKENGYNVCKTKSGDEMVVEHYWEKKEAKKKKKEEKQTLKYKGVKDSEIKKYTSCEDDGNKKVCTTKGGTKEKVETYWHFNGKENISQIRKPDHKPFYAVDFEDGHGKHLYRDDIIRLTM